MKFSGVYTAIVTPFRNGKVDTQALDTLVEAQIAGGIHGLVVLGTTGECPVVSHREHIEVVQRVVKTTAGRVPVIAGAGANNTQHAIDVSRGCEELDVAGLLHVTPYYNKPSQEGLCRHFEAIADATRTPIIVYNVPGRTAVDLQPASVARLAKHERIVGIKEATGSMLRAAELKRSVPSDFALLSGDDFTAYPFFALGGHGLISVVSNVMPAKTARLWDAIVEGKYDEAQALQLELLPMIELLFAESSPAPTKAALELLGQMSAEVRLPLVPCTEALQSRLREQLVRAGLL